MDKMVFTSEAMVHELCKSLEILLLFPIYMYIGLKYLHLTSAFSNFILNDQFLLISKELIILKLFQ
jgi:hypothetical protein